MKQTFMNTSFEILQFLRNSLSQQASLDVFLASIKKVHVFPLMSKCLDSHGQLEKHFLIRQTIRRIEILFRFRLLRACSICTTYFENFTYIHGITRTSLVALKDSKFQCKSQYFYPLVLSGIDGTIAYI